MIKLFLTTACLFIFSLNVAQARSEIKDRIHKLKWGQLDVVWLEDNRFPTYLLDIYFADGALSDGEFKGLTHFTFDLLDKGTRRFDQRAISDNLEFYGASWGGNVTHEYSSYQLSGLTKDITPSVKKLCHLFADAVYPKKEISKEKQRYRSQLSNIINNPSALASKVIRELSLQGTPYSYPVEGKLKDLKYIQQARLKKQLEYFRTKVAKTIYLTGPKEVLNIEPVITQECGFQGKGDYRRTTGIREYSSNSSGKMFLVTVPKANQAQVRLGRFLNPQQIHHDELLTFASEFLGGGFTSVLMQEIRVKRGLSYGVSTYAGGQKEYGRAGINTFTKTETIGTLLDVISETLQRVGKGEFSQDKFAHSKSNLLGSFPFRFESSEALLQQLMHLDHRGLDYDQLFEFPKKIQQVSKEKLTKTLKEIFSWENQTGVVIGPSDLKSKLKDYKVEMRSYKDFL